MIKDFLKNIECREKGFDERMWEGAPPLCSELDNLVREHLPEEKKKDLDAILYGVGADGYLEEQPDHAVTIAEAEDRAWELIQIKKKFEFIFRFLVR